MCHSVNERPKLAPLELGNDAAPRAVLNLNWAPYPTGSDWNRLIMVGEFAVNSHATDSPTSHAVEFQKFAISRVRVTTAGMGEKV